ncbi:MAG: alpha/beta fold hydrolase [Ruminococcus sp.]|nr:alpha/beta fold hydrolase [Ruminococcus sp.]
MKRKKKRVVSILLLIAILIAGAGIWYVNDYYKSEDIVQEYINGNINGNAPVAVKEIDTGLFLDGPGTEHAIIFYPGAKVEYTAYVPLFYELAEQGIDAFLVKMPCNLAILGQNKAEAIMEAYEYEHWYLSGHSLGGAMAASLAAANPENLDGLVLLAAYPTASLPDTISVISIYGSEDGVLNMEKLEEGRSYMPSDYKEICIEGGNHAWFGYYGEQEGDGIAAISKEEQQAQTAAAVLKLVECMDGQSDAESEVVGTTTDARLRADANSDSDKTENQEEKTMTYQQITPQEAKELMDTREDIIVLDVRTLQEYETGHIIGALNLPNEDIWEEPEILPDMEQTILVYCRSGNRSKQAAQKLADLGYENVLEFGGIIDWPYQEMVE